nr:MAG TPA: hypothetical protein [Microviridae sp.]
MLKDYADQFYSIDLKVQENFDLYTDAEEFMQQFPAFSSYSIARRYIKVVPNGYYFSYRRNSGEECQNVVMLFDGVYYVLPYLAKQEFLAFYQVKSKKNKE